MPRPDWPGIKWKKLWFYVYGVLAADWVMFSIPSTLAPLCCVPTQTVYLPEAAYSISITGSAPLPFDELSVTTQPGETKEGK